MNWAFFLHTYWRTPDAPVGLYLRIEVLLLDSLDCFVFHDSVHRGPKIPNLPPHCTQRNLQAALSNNRLVNLQDRAFLWVMMPGLVQGLHRCCDT